MREPDILITGEMLRLVGAIDEFKGTWRAIGNLAPDRLHALKRIATIESVGSSTRIEGARLSDREVEALLSGIAHHSFRSRDEEEVAGYAAVMDLIFEAHREIPLTENHIRQLHGTLLRFSDRDARHRGNYKSVPNNIEAFDPSGKSLGVIFETASPFDTPRRMAELVEWTDTALTEGRHHPLLVIGIFCVHFLAIHPFQDGNGRISRALTTLLLLKSGYAYVPFSSLERVVEMNNEAYYLCLRRGQTTLAADDAGLGEWLLFFLRCLKDQADNLARKIDMESRLSPLSTEKRDIVEAIKDHGPLAISEINALIEINRSTLKLRLQELIAENYLAVSGRGRGTRYGLGSRPV